MLAQSALLMGGAAGGGSLLTPVGLIDTVFNVNANPQRLRTTSAIPVGDTVVVIMGAKDGDTHAVADDRSNTYAEALYGTSSAESVSIHYAVLTTALQPGDDIDAFTGNSRNGKTFAAFHIAGGATQVVHDVDTGSVIPVIPNPPAGAIAFAVARHGSSALWTAPLGWTDLANNSGGARGTIISWRVEDGQLEFNPTGGSTSDRVAGIAAFA